MAGLVPVPVSSAAATTSAPLAPVVLPKTSESEQLLKIRHSMSHVMAMAVQKLFPNAQVTIGPWTEAGFYYDFDNPEPFTEDDLKAIKKEMKSADGLPTFRVLLSLRDAESKCPRVAVKVFKQEHFWSLGLYPASSTLLQLQA